MVKRALNLLKDRIYSWALGYGPDSPILGSVLKGNTNLLNSASPPIPRHTSIQPISVGQMVQECLSLRYWSLEVVHGLLCPESQLHYHIAEDDVRAMEEVIVAFLAGCRQRDWL